MLIYATLLLLSVLAAGIPQATEFPILPSPLPQANNRQGTFNETRAYAVLIRQTRFGPRDPGSKGHERCLKYLRDVLSSEADAVVDQSFEYDVAHWKRVRLTNLFASFNLRAANRIFISAHWDSRPWADQDPDTANRSMPIAGANDGASGAAVILELARVLRQFPPPVGVDLILFDGEDLGKSGVGESFSAGARFFSKHLPERFTPRFGINIDMIGDKNLQIEREQNSERLAPEIQDMVFTAARRLALTGFVNVPGSEITDDHIPMNEAGFPTIDLIDFKYPDESNRYWHTMADTPDKCSAGSLGVVGKLLLEIIYTQH